jgi:hypothetical protein
VKISGFTGGEARVLPGVDYQFTVETNPQVVGTFDAYRLVVYGGSKTDLEAAMAPQTMLYNVGNASGTCKQAFDLSSKDTAFVIADLSGLSNAHTSASYTLNFKSGGTGYVFATVSGYNYNDPVMTMTGQDFCQSSLVTTRATATSFPVESQGWGCSRGICMINVQPQTLPTGSNTATYQVYLSSLDPNYTYAYVTGRYEQQDISRTTAVSMCKAVINPTAGSGAGLATSSERVAVHGVDPETVGTTYRSPTFSISFNDNAPVKRMVAYLMKFDKNAASMPVDGSACDSIISSAGWAYDGSSGSGTGGTATPTPTPTPVTPQKPIDTSGGFIATDLEDTDPSGRTGFFLSGICKTGSNINIALSNNQGTIDLNNAGLMGICTPNIGGQVLKLLMILAAFFFTVAVIISGIAMVRATDSSALETAKKNLIASAIGAFLIVFANWIVPAFISLISKLFA